MTSAQPLPPPDAPGIPSPPRAERDRCGVPVNLLGQHHEDFYSIIGRIITLCSLLDERLHILDARLKTVDAPRAAPNLNAVIKSCWEQLPTVADENLRAALELLLDESDRYRHTRNDAAHSLFPAQADGTVVWWRQDGNRLQTFAPGAAAGPADIATEDPYRPTTLDGWRNLVRQLADLVVAADSLTWRLSAST
ncbi:hypothetical protein ASE25_11425 [Terrabacter sp. Root85]|uniref:hypothetical protein n=1 Tax=Terrabacter sp. Root85 TaxID=1736603 RepID=UPI0006FECB7B|nr:hypothetical protein [Terrabacter sp. Root85]KRC90092.1 hypothetical protein ASE25_11425 [Terrabacter sp. Root85]